MAANSNAAYARLDQKIISKHDDLHFLNRSMYVRLMRSMSNLLWVHILSNSPFSLLVHHL